MALTYHYDPRDNDFVFEAWANPPTNKCEDADPLETWRDEVNTDIWYRAASRPTWRFTGSPFPLPSVEYNGSSNRHDQWNAALSVQRRLSDWIAGSALTLMVAVYVESASLNAGSPFGNHPIWFDFSSACGIHVKNVSGQIKVTFANNDGVVDVVEKNINLNTRYVLMARHESGNIYLSVNGGAESSVASGDTSTLTGFMGLGGSGTEFFDGFIGQIKCWNTGNADGNQATELQTMIDDWVGSSVPPLHVPVINSRIHRIRR